MLRPQRAQRAQRSQKVILFSLSSVLSVVRGGNTPVKRGTEECILKLGGYICPQDTYTLPADNIDGDVFLFFIGVTSSISDFFEDFLNNGQCVEILFGDSS